jgi:putative ATPase
MSQHCVAYLAEAPKSTRAYTAYKRVRSLGSSIFPQFYSADSPQAEALASETPLPPIPLQIRNAPTGLMKKLGYGREYAYNPDYAHPVHNVSWHALWHEDFAIEVERM